MPPRVKISKKEIIEGALELVRELGIEGLCARSLATRLGISTQPIFSNFQNMEELVKALTERAREISFEHTKSIIESGVYPPYKSSGIAYIRFAAEERELFNLLFMMESGRMDDFTGYEDIIERMRVSLGTTKEIAKQIHFQTWTFVHGIATMIYTGYLSIDEDMVSEMLTNIYEGLKFRYNLTATPKGE